ncbi:GNAT family N-acetyltransferase [Rossellomorea aquimaris]|uniref:GNAT family N-acetyltransferase n=1 Tax=Rossellomorea aquimaris TaxID=189382 RepID=UPI001CD7A2CF|nr:GNAT family N-acetyltransferase [Rossellomorea aquimaris]MCA1058488.1 GNAT family N-acetyltransferase [Rossellomorea aquimaris]
MIVPCLTHKVHKLIKQAHELAERNQHTYIQSIDLFLGAALVKEGTLREMHDLLEPYSEQLERLLKTLSPEPSSGIVIDSHSMPVSLNTLNIWNVSVNIMKRYNQTYLNEGHIIKAFFSLLSEQPQLEQGLQIVPQESIIQSVTVARNLSVHLLTRDWSLRKADQVKISSVQAYEKEHFLSWSGSHFGEVWSDTLRNAFQSNNPLIPIYKAEVEGRLIGFAAYDVFMDKKGVFGPMGVLPDFRHDGVGRRLLYAALESMKEKGYMYAMLIEAGPIEFYEKTCNAKLIPMEEGK